MLDLAIHDALLIDGSGSPGIRCDVGIRGARIESVTSAGELRNADAAERVDAEGLCLTPGFIDSHTHSDVALLGAPDALPKVRQGVTTEIVGNCGWSTVPGGYPESETYRRLGQPIFGYPDVPWTWDDQAGYERALAHRGTAVNVAALVGHGALRAAVLGFEDRPATVADMQRMKALLDSSMRQGALGLSTGLAYVPGCYSPTAELSELAQVVSSHDGIYATHLRDQGDGLLDSVEEALAIGTASGASVLISHHKTVGRRNFGRVRQTLTRLDDAYASGLATYSDIYPYLAGSSTMLALLPPWVLQANDVPLVDRLRDPATRTRIRRDLREGLDGWENRARTVGWESIRVAAVASARNRGLVGQTLSDIARLRRGDPVDTMLDLLADEDGNVNSLIVNSCEEDLVTVLQHPRTMIGSDGIDVGEQPHPRLYGTFPRVLARYVRDRRDLTLEQAIHKMTGLTARVFGLARRGLVRPGYVADLVLFDAAAIQDLADYDEPRRFPSGISDVWVGGKRVVARGSPSGLRPGRFLRRARHADHLSPL